MKSEWAMSGRSGKSLWVWSKLSERKVRKCISGKSINGGVVINSSWRGDG